MQNTQEVQEIEQGQDVIVQNIDAKLPIEVYEAIWEYWGKKILPNRIIDNIFSIGECATDTAYKEGVPAADLMREILGGKFDKNGYPTNKKHRAIVESAEKSGSISGTLSETISSIIIDAKIDKIDYPTDKINNNIWKLLEEADNSGQITFAVEKEGSKREANIIYSIDFEALEGVTITKKLTSYDKRVYIAVGALFNSGYDDMTISQIYNAMGNANRPSATDREKINDSLTKMSAAKVYINNESEKQLYNKRVLFVYDASLLPMERIRAVVNGKATAKESAIHLFREPPLISFARGRKQITTINRCLLESPLSKTPDNLTIDDYLIENIAYIKHSKGDVKNKMLYTTIFEKCGFTDKLKRNRAKKKIPQYLEHYKKCGYIKDFKEEADGITIFY